VRLQDVAAEAGVSVNTVSRALTGKSDVNDRTRERVQKVAKRLGYTPNVLARSLVQGATRTVGLIVSDCTAPYYAHLIREVETVTTEAGFGLLLATSNDDVEKEQQALRIMRERCVDGILLTAVDVRAEHISAVISGTVPLVLLSRRPRGYRGPFVGTDNVLGARLAVRHLVEAGHQRIAHLSRSDTPSSARERAQGWRQELRRHGLPADPSLLHRTVHTPEGGREAVKWLLGLEARPTAVFTYSDVLAVGLLAGLREAGVDVPREMSVIGFDDIALASMVTPPLTTIAQGIGEIGCRGASILIARLQDARESEETVVLAPRLIERGTVAECGRRGRSPRLRAL